MCFQVFWCDFRGNAQCTGGSRDVPPCRGGYNGVVVLVSAEFVWEPFRCVDR